MRSQLPISISRHYRVSRGWLAGLLMLIGWMVMGTAWAERLTLRYPLEFARDTYPVKLLALALDKSGVDYNLAPFEVDMPQGRALLQMSRGQDINVLWTMTSIEREQQFLPIRIPIDKGLLGWRLFLISRENQEAFSNVKTLADLKLYSAGQGHDWPDTAILRANGLDVQVAARYDGLFKMLLARRFDYFPRSIMEIWAEQKRHALDGIVVEETVMLQYPTALYFFVNKDNKPLANTIEKGLNAAIKDGSFDMLFNHAYGDVMLRANIKARTRLKLTNPLLPAETPLGRKELWVH